MSDCIQSWNDKVAEALTFAKRPNKDFKVAFSFNAKNITYLEFSDRDTFISLSVHLVSGQSVYLSFEPVDIEHANTVYTYLTCLMSAS
mgnify:FL=1